MKYILSIAAITLVSILTSTILIKEPWENIGLFIGVASGAFGLGAMWETARGRRRNKAFYEYMQNRHPNSGLH